VSSVASWLGCAVRSPSRGGRDVLARAYPVVSEHQNEAFAALTKGERAELARILGKLMR
jgi:hypothetical protein